MDPITITYSIIDGCMVLGCLVAIVDNNPTFKGTLKAYGQYAAKVLGLNQSNNAGDSQTDEGNVEEVREPPMGIVPDRQIEVLHHVGELHIHHHHHHHHYHIQNNHYHNYYVQQPSMIWDYLVGIARELYNYYFPE